VFARAIYRFIPAVNIVARANLANKKPCNRQAIEMGRYSAEYISANILKKNRGESQTRFFFQEI